VRRAGWLHDIGRIGISSRVWGHPGPLSPHDWEQVRLHPYYTDRVLDRTAFLRRLGAVASGHHERIDGSGYFRGARTPQLSRGARVLAAADVFHAMTEPRPHRAALSARVAAAELGREVAAGRLDGDAADAVLTAAGQEGGRRRRRSVAGLTPREVQTLAQLARGLSIKQIARVFGIAPKTVDGHIQRIYAKTGVSTRAGATLYAMQHDLIDIVGGSGEDREISP
jgi:HD-GYP domain-containing protein (c-di-GMP phosphodiesterase class II)